MLTNAYTRQRDREAVKDWNRHIDTERFQEPAQAIVWNCECGWTGDNERLDFKTHKDNYLIVKHLCPECGARVRRSKKWQW